MNTNTLSFKSRLIALALLAAFAVTFFAPVTQAEAGTGQAVATYTFPIRGDDTVPQVNWNGGVPK